jgi:hypothetical protein
MTWRKTPSMTTTTDKKNPQERKLEKIRAALAKIGYGGAVEVRLDGGEPRTVQIDLPDEVALAIWNTLQVGLIPTNKEAEEAKGYRLHCSSEWHFARFTGEGSSLAPLLYNVSFHLGGASESFHLSLRNVAEYLDTKEEVLYAAAGLLVASGFWEISERGGIAKPTMYRPVGHKEWAEKRGGIFCTVKAEFPFKDETEEAKLGAKLFGITAEKYFTDVLTGWLRLGTSEQLQEWAIEFMKEDGGKGKKMRRKRLAEFFKQKAGKV